MMHKIGMHLKNYECYYTPYYCDGFLKLLYKANLLSFTVIGKQHQQKVIEYCSNHGLNIDFGGDSRDYDLIITSSDLIIQKNIRKKKIVLVQEGMTDPINVFYYLSKYLGLPRYLASTSTAGLSDAYDRFFVASDGYAEHFINNGCDASKISVTGIPNFDNVNEFRINSFPYKNFVLAATSDTRETFKYENRKKFIYRALDIAGGRKLIFKLHPNENFNRATKEIQKYAPGALVFCKGNTEQMIANCDVLITKYSSVVYIGMALGKVVYSDFDLDMLRNMTPLQNGGTSGKLIAGQCARLIENESVEFNKKTEAETIPGIIQGNITGEAA
ncbi:MAG: hypothetical protein IAE90_15190 [Ignavibacteria bacterium]|nr:hypothetical protein [Ignavibacteria bacterium]